MSSTMCFDVQLLDVYGSLLERPLIRQEFDANYATLMDMVENDLFNVKTLYDQHVQVKICSFYALSYKGPN